jgi:hypothetical protein
MAANYPAAADFGHVYGQMGQGGTSGFFATGGKRNSPYQLCRSVLPKGFFFLLCKPKSFRHTIAQCIPGKIVPAAFPANRLCGCRRQIGTNVCHINLLNDNYVYYIRLFHRKSRHIYKKVCRPTVRPNTQYNKAGSGGGNRIQCGTKLESNFAGAMFVPS